MCVASKSGRRIDMSVSYEVSDSKSDGVVDINDASYIQMIISHMV